MPENSEEGTAEENRTATFAAPPAQLLGKEIPGEQAWGPLPWWSWLQGGAHFSPVPPTSSTLLTSFRLNLM